ncbi:MFS transporter [Solirubrobacter taibaiensis]|nr:MFS transporter [Solirubrobacter taibaiensis]
MGRWWTLLAVCLGTFMLLVDVTIVNVALPAIEEDLGSAFEDLQWVIDAYALTLAAALLAGGSLADLLGRRRIYVIGVVLFTFASLLCGLAGSPLMLNLARGLQGVGAGLMFACSLALLANTYRGKDRGTAFGIWGATTGAAVAIGPLAGGILTDLIGWEAIFFVNLPIGVLVVALTLRYVAESRNEHAGGIDVLGLVLFSAALAALVFGLIRGNDEGFTSPLILTLLIGSAVLLVAFVFVQRTAKYPTFDLSLFRVPTFVGGLIAAFVLSAAMFACFLYLTLYMQNQLGYTALEAGVRFLPISLLSFVVAPISGKLAERLGVRWFIGAGLLFVAGALFSFSGLDVGDDWTALLPGMILGGIGIGMVNAPLATTAVGVVEPQRAGVASGINSTARQVGIATGTAVYGAIAAGVIDGRAPEFAQAVGGRIPQGVEGSFSDFILFGAYEQLGERAIEPGRAAFIAGLDQLLVVGSVVALVGAVLCFVLIRPRDFVDHA